MTRRSKWMTVWILAGIGGCSDMEPREEISGGDAGVGGASEELLTGPWVAPRSCPDPDAFVASGFQNVDPVALLSGAASNCAAPTANSPCAPHHVYTPDVSVPLREPLFVFLPGTNMEPNKHDLVLQTAAHAGYRTIGLSYDNTVSASAACVGFDDCGLNCRALMREEVLRGVDQIPSILVDRGDSILVRLYRALEELDAIDPAGGWGSYYVPTAGSIRPSNILWENIIFGGFSQGAGHAAFISHQRLVHGLFVLDGAADTCVDPATGAEEPAEWFAATPDESAGRPKYGIHHDRGLGATTVADPWQALGLGTALFNLDCTSPFCVNLGVDTIDAIPPRQASATDQGFPAAPAICSEHMSMARDACMPTDLAGATGATTPPDHRLFGAYLRRLCYACDAATCP